MSDVREPDFNDRSRTVSMFTELSQHMDAARDKFLDELRSEPERINRVVADLGEVANAIDAGTANAVELLHRPLVPLLLWLEQAKREQAW